MWMKLLKKYFISCVDKRLFLGNYRQEINHLRGGGLEMTNGYTFFDYNKVILSAAIQSKNEFSLFYHIAIRSAF